MTWQARTLLGISLGLLLIGVLADSPIQIATGTFGLLSLMLVRITLGAHPKITLVHVSFDEIVARGVHASIVYTLQSHSRNLTRKTITVEAAPLEPLLATLPRSVGIMDVLVPVPTGVRQLISVPRVSLTHADPWGLYLKEVVTSSGFEIAVVPLPSDLDLAQWSDPIKDEPLLPFGFTTGYEDLEKIREYMPGDDVRMIHWRNSARTGEIMVRESVAPASPPLTHVLLDTHVECYASAEAFENAVELAAALVDHFSRENTAFILTTSTESVPFPAIDSWTSAMRKLAAVQPDFSSHRLPPSMVDKHPSKSIVIVDSNGISSPSEDVRLSTPFNRALAAGERA